jgi:hypothetical protein
LVRLCPTTIRPFGQGRYGLDFNTKREYKSQSAHPNF